MKKPKVIGGVNGLWFVVGIRAVGYPVMVHKCTLRAGGLIGVVIRRGARHMNVAEAVGSPMMLAFIPLCGACVFY